MLNSGIGLGFVFTARDLASGAIENLERKFTSLDKRVGLGAARIDESFRQLGVGLAVFTAGAIALGGAFALANTAGVFEQSLAAVGAVSNASTDELQQLRDAAIDAGIATQFSPTEATLGLRELAQAGFDAETSMKLLVPALDLAGGSMGELSPQQAAGLAAQALKAFGIESADAAVSVDQMLKSANLFALGAGELPLALGVVSRGAQTLNQSLSETLIAFGLVKDIVPGVERAATAVAVAMERLADPEVRARMAGIGVAVTDSGGRFRSFLDIIGEMAPRLDRMNEAQRAAFLLQTFGREALAGVNAMLTQVTNGVKTGTGTIVRGAEAFAYLRSELANASGTAAEFRTKMLDTFAGQKQLLRGSLETLAIVIGQPFAQLLRPVVTTVVDGLNTVLRALRALPEPVKKAFAGIALGAAAFATLVGAALLVKGAMLVVTIGMAAVGVSVGSLASLFLPVLGVLALLVAGGAAFARAFERDLGGLGSFVRRLGREVKLMFQGLGQLIEQGGFSGALREELNRAENQGLKRFLIGVYQVVYRLQQVWEGFKAGFVATVDAAGPVFVELVEAFRELGDEVSALFGGMTLAATGLPSSEFKSFGATVGGALATLVTWGVEALAAITRFVGGILAGFRIVRGFVTPALTAIGQALDRLSTAWASLQETTEDATGTVGKSVSVWRQLGAILGGTIGAAVTFVAWSLAGLIDVVTIAIVAIKVVSDAFVDAGDQIGETAAGIYLWFSETLPTAISSAWSTTTRFFRGMGQFFAGFGRTFTGLFSTIASGITGFLNPVVEFFRGVGRAIKAVFDAISDLVIKLLRKVPDELLPSSLERLKRQPLSIEVREVDPFAVAGTSMPAARAAAMPYAMPAVADVAGRSNQFSQLEQNIMAYANAQAGAKGLPPPFTINVQVDGETIARATHQANRDAASRSFSTVPAW